MGADHAKPLEMVFTGLCIAWPRFCITWDESAGVIRTYAIIILTLGTFVSNDRMRSRLGSPSGNALARWTYDLHYSDSFQKRKVVIMTCPSRFSWTLASRSLALIALTFVAVPDLYAVPLAPGTFVTLSGTSAAARPELAGTVLSDVDRPFSVDLSAFGGGIIRGTVQDRVVRETVSGTLDCSYRIFSDANSAGTIIRASRMAFTGVSSDVDYRTDGLGRIHPQTAGRSARGGEVEFDFTQTDGTPNTLGPGTTSLFFFVHTNAVDFNEGGSLRIDAHSTISPIPVGGSSFPIATFQPTTVPEPSTFLLLASGLSGVVACRRRARKGRGRAVGSTEW